MLRQLVRPAGGLVGCLSGCLLQLADQAVLLLAFSLIGAAIVGFFMFQDRGTKASR